MGRIAARILAGLLAVGSAAPIVMALALALFNVAVSAQQPDPTVPDGDPCCGNPDTWGEVALGFVGAAIPEGDRFSFEAKEQCIDLPALA